MKPLPVVAAALALCIAGCMTPEFKRPVVDLPTAWRIDSTTNESLAERPWGELFRTAELQALINTALTENSDLRIAAARVELVRAQYGLQRSNLFPTVAADAGYDRTRQPSAASAVENRSSEIHSFGLAIPSWEIDIWGRVRSLNEAAYRNFIASEENRRALQTSLIAQVALTYLDLMSLDAQLETARQTAKTRTDSLRLVKLRFTNGVVSAVDLHQAESLLAGAEATIFDLERRLAQTENALSVLTGRNPGPVIRQSRLSDFNLLPQLPAGLPSQLIERRPDVRAAENTLAASEANVDAARKAYLPTISLTAFLGFISPEGSTLFDSNRRASSVNPAVTLPIFTAGRLESNVDAARAQQSIALEQYRQSIQVALREVEDALVGYQRLREQRDSQQRVADAERKRLRLTQSRYRGGVSSYFEVLDAERQSFSADLSLLQTTRDVYASVVQLYRALGGGWTPPATGAQVSQQGSTATP
jgi:multidrug efflux system outer membrane protein